MQTATRGATPVARVPPFALNDNCFRKSFCTACGATLTIQVPVPETINREEINKAATAKALRGYPIGKFGVVSSTKYAETSCRRAQSWRISATACLIAFRSWRLGMDSVEVAASVGMTPQAVRQALWRMRAVAKELGYDVGRAGHTSGVCRRQIEQEAEVLKKYRSGKSIPKLQPRVDMHFIVAFAGIFKDPLPGTLSDSEGAKSVKSRTRAARLLLQIVQWHRQ